MYGRDSYNHWRKNITLKCCRDSSIIITASCVACPKTLAVFEFKSICSPGPRWQKSTLFSYAGSVLEGLAKQMPPSFRLSFQNFVIYLSMKRTSRQRASRSSRSFLTFCCCWFIRTPELEVLGHAFISRTGIFLVLSSQNKTILYVALKFLICGTCICVNRQCVCSVNAGGLNRHLLDF